MAFGLLLGTSLLTYVPASVLIYFTIMPYAFVTATFLKSMFYQFLVLFTTAILWITFQQVPHQYAYLLIFSIYSVGSAVSQIALQNDSNHEYNAFAIVGSNNAIHPTHPIHRSWAVGLGWGLAEATIFYGLPILTQVGGISENASIFPLPTTPCGQFSSFTPFPIVIPTAVMWMAVFLINGLLALGNGMIFANIRPRAVPILIFFHICIHYALYVVTWGVRSTDFCWASIVIPPAFILFTIFYLWILKGCFHPSDPTASKAAMAARRVREIGQRERQEAGYQLDTSTFDRHEGHSQGLSTGGYVRLGDGLEEEEGNSGSRQRRGNDNNYNNTNNNNQTDRDQNLFHTYGRGDQNDIYGS